MEMKVRDLNDGIRAVVFQGALDTDGAGKVDASLATLTDAKNRLLIDMADVTYLSSIGIRALIQGARSVVRHGGRMVLVRPRPNVDRILRLAGTHQVVPIFADIESAKAELAALA